MTRSLSVSDTGLRLIKAFEGFRPVDKELVTGVRVVGYGHRVLSQTPIHMTEEQAEETLLLDLKAYEELINEEVHAPLTQSQFDALVSLAFNIGPKAFRESDVLRALNNGRPLDAAAGFDIWRKATIEGKTFVVDALMRRRTAEKSLFLRTEGIIPAPTALLEPKADHETGLGPIADGLPVFTEDDAIGIIVKAPYDANDRDELEADDDVLTLSDEMEVETDVDVEVEPEPEDDGSEFSDLAALMAGSFAPLAVSDDGEADETEVALSPDAVDNTNAPHDNGEDSDEDADTNNDDDDRDGSAPTTIDDDTVEPDDDDQLKSAARDVEETPIVSPISDAADALGERLSALLDSDETDEDETVVEMPESLIEAPDDTRRSNLVTFPSRQLADPAPLDSDAGTIDNAEDLVTGDASSGSAKTPIMIDNLAADDVIRSSREPKENIYDPEGDAVENAERYLERMEEAGQSDRAGGGMWIPLILGGTLVGVSAVLLGRGATSLLNAWGPASVIAAAVTGGLMIIFTLYAAARGRFA